MTRNHRDDSPDQPPAAPVGADRDAGPGHADHHEVPGHTDCFERLQARAAAYQQAWHCLIGALNTDCEGMDARWHLDYARQLAADLNPDEALQLGVDPMQLAERKHAERGEPR